MADYDYDIGQYPPDVSAEAARQLLALLQAQPRRQGVAGNILQGMATVPDPAQATTGLGFLAQALKGVGAGLGATVAERQGPLASMTREERLALLPKLAKEYAPRPKPTPKPGEKTILEAADGDMSKVDKLLQPYANYPVSMTDDLLRALKPKEFAPAKPAKPTIAKSSAASEKAGFIKKLNIQSALGDIMSRTPAIVVEGGKEIPGPAKSIEDIKNMVRIRYKLDPDAEPEIKEAISRVQYFAPWLGRNYYQYVPPETTKSPASTATFTATPTSFKVMDKTGKTGTYQGTRQEAEKDGFVIIED